MNDLIDQFGRDKSKNLNNIINDDKSKQILESLSEIKKQLENKDYSPEIEVNDNASDQNVKNKKIKNLDFYKLQQRIELLEEKLITLNNQTSSKNHKTEFNTNEIVQFEKSIFHSFRNDDDYIKGKSLLVLENQNQSRIFQFKFYHFLIVTITMTITLILLMSFKLKKGFLEITKMFFSNFN